MWKIQEKIKHLRLLFEMLNYCLGTLRMSVIKLLTYKRKDSLKACKRLWNIRECCTEDSSWPVVTQEQEQSQTCVVGSGSQLCIKNANFYWKASIQNNNLQVWYSFYFDVESLTHIEDSWVIQMWFNHRK